MQLFQFLNSIWQSPSQKTVEESKRSCSIKWSMLTDKELAWRKETNGTNEKENFSLAKVNQWRALWFHSREVAQKGHSKRVCYFSCLGMCLCMSQPAGKDYGSPQRSHTRVFILKQLLHTHFTHSVNPIWFASVDKYLTSLGLKLEQYPGCPEQGRCLLPLGARRRGGKERSGSGTQH